jgi:hydroxymethylpyrimidine pyrophosphatase-like HAD family hydrolase
MRSDPLPLRGCLALDVDGTLTDEALRLPKAVSDRLNQLSQQGWLLLFLTGRTSTLVSIPLQSIRVPYVLAAQQGSLLLRMPQREVLEQWRLPTSMVSRLSQLAAHYGLAVVAYGGWGWDDTAWTVPSDCHPEQLQQIARLESFGAEPWKTLANWEELPCDSVPLIKLFGEPAGCRALEYELQADSTLHVSRIQDPFHPSYDLLLVTHPQANKGRALKSLREHLASNHLPVIAAGNDLNDLELLREADVAIAMAGSPPDLLRVADLIAPPCSQMGILPALEAAMQRVGSP